MNIVSYLVRIWHALLTPEDLLEMTEEQVNDYQRDSKKPVEQRSNATINPARRTWKAILGVPQAEGAKTIIPGEPQDSKPALIHMLTPDIMTGLMDLGVGGIDLKLLIRGDDDEWEIMWGGYVLEVEDIVQQVVMSVFKKSEEREVRDRLDRKMKWVLMDHNTNHYQRRLPLLTPGDILKHLR